MATTEKIKRGVKHPATVVAVKKRRYSKPIPDDFLPRFEAAGLIVDDNDHNVTVYRDGRPIGRVWGPAADGSRAWFASCNGSATIRVCTRDDGLSCVLGVAAAAVAELPAAPEPAPVPVPTAEHGSAGPRGACASGPGYGTSRLVDLGAVTRWRMP